MYYLIEYYPNVYFSVYISVPKLLQLRAQTIVYSAEDGL